MDRNAEAIKTQLMQALTQIRQLEQAGAQLMVAARKIEQERDRAEMDRVTTLRHLLCVLLEHQKGRASVTIPLFESLQHVELRLRVTPPTQKNPLSCLLEVTDTAGNAVSDPDELPEPTTLPREDLAVSEPEQPKAERCPECYLAFGEHRAGCSRG